MEKNVALDEIKRIKKTLASLDKSTEERLADIG